MSLPPGQTYQKTWLDDPDQVDLLVRRGLIVGDVRAAERFPSHANFYRYSGYCLAFQSGSAQFKAGGPFEFGGHRLGRLAAEGLEVLDAPDAGPEFVRAGADGVAPPAEGGLGAAGRPAAVLQGDLGLEAPPLVPGERRRQQEGRDDFVGDRGCLCVQPTRQRQDFISASGLTC